MIFQYAVHFFRGSVQRSLYVNKYDFALYPAFLNWFIMFIMAQLGDIFHLSGNAGMTYFR